MPKFIDVHVHGFLKPALEENFFTIIRSLTEEGLEKIVITVLPYHTLDFQQKLHLTPPHIQPALSKENVDETTLLTTWTKQYGLQHTVIPFLDVRFLTERIEETVRFCLSSGFRGIKGAYLPAPDQVLRTQGIPDVLGIPIAHYQSLQEEIFTCALKYKLPLLYHINLSQYLEWISYILKQFPSIKVNIPHLGYSMRGISNILNRFENTYTDPAFLLPLLRKNNQRYLNFIKEYHLRILLGSDAIMTANPLQEIIAYAQYFAHLPMPEPIRQRILRENAYSFLSCSND